METVPERVCPLALLVDDDMIVRILVREVLEQSGHEVCEAENGTQALERFIEYRPDIVLLDIMMPGMDGFTACAKLRELVGGRRVPILMMTALDDTGSIEQASEHGATDLSRNR